MDAKKENEEKKEYLRSYRRHGSRIKRIEAEIEEIRSMKMHPSAIKYDGMPHGSDRNDFSDYAAELEKMENECYQEGVKQVKTYKEIKYEISRIDNEDERDVLFYKYIKGKSFWEIAQIMDYTERWVKKLHGRGLKKIEIPKEDTPVHP